MEHQPFPAVFQFILSKHQNQKIALSAKSSLSKVSLNKRKEQSYEKEISKVIIAKFNFANWYTSRLVLALPIPLLAITNHHEGYPLKYSFPSAPFLYSGETSSRHSMSTKQMPLPHCIKRVQKPYQQPLHSVRAYHCHFAFKLNNKSKIATENDFALTVMFNE